MMLNVLALCGSLRAASINAALLRTAAQLAPPQVAVTLARSLGELPLFNPDLEAQVPRPVAAFRREVAAAAALLIASPEYAHGPTGTMKNALDWLVSFEPFVGKPVALLNAAPRAHHADDALRETLRTMSAVIVEPASLTIDGLSGRSVQADMLASPHVARALRQSLAALHLAVSEQARQGPAFPLG